jgi:nucleoside-diphosphate-sugar epimerase
MAGILDKRTVLVTGATGFVGSAVARTLLAEGCTVIGLVRSKAKGAELSAAGARTVVGDMLEPSTYEHLVADADAIVHAAQLRACGRVSAGQVRRMKHANSVMTGALAESCRAAGKRFVYTGGCFVYGDHGSNWISESTPLAPSPLGEADAIELARLRELHQKGLDVVVLSPGFVYGPGGNFKAAFYDQARKGRLRCIGAGDNYWSCVHVDDLAAAYAAALAHAEPGEEYNIVDDSPLSLSSFVDQIAAMMGGKRRANLPRWVAALAVGAPAIASLTTSYRVDNGKAQDRLGWAPVCSTVAEGLPPTLTVLERDA